MTLKVFIANFPIVLQWLLSLITWNKLLDSKVVLQGYHKVKASLGNPLRVPPINP